jgi:hypothetical protein
VDEGAVLDITGCRRYFLEPGEARQRQYEALRAYFVENLPSAEVARRFGYTPGSFRVLCHEFRRTARPDFFSPPVPVGRRPSSRMARARDQAVALRKQNYSVYDISEALKERELDLSPTAIRQILREEGFAPLPRRLDEERPEKPGPQAQAYADARAFGLVESSFETVCGGLYLFLPDLVRLGIERVAQQAGLPGSKMIPAGHALRSALALKLWSVERKSHVMPLVADPGLALFPGLNVIPKKSYLSEYSHGIDHARTLRLLAAWQDALSGEGLYESGSFNLDFHSVPYYGEDPVIERHYVSMRSRRQPSVLAFLAQDSDSRAFCYSNADLRKGDEPEEVFRFLEFWKKQHGQLPRELVFDSKLTTYASLARLHKLGVQFITLRRRDAGLLEQIAALPRSAWRTIELDNVTRRFRTPRVYETSVTLAGCALRQFFIQDLGHEEPTILLTNQSAVTAKRLITRYAQRMLIENSISDSVRFFHSDALSSSVGMKVDFDMALLVIASGLYRILARRMRGYSDAQARRVFRDLIDMPASITTTPSTVRVHFHRRAHLPIILASGMLDARTPIPWWNNAVLTFASWGKDR